MVETLAIQKVMMQAINDRYSKVIIESDSRIAIQIISEKFHPSKDICNLVQDIIVLTKNVINIQFVFYKRYDNELTDMIAEGTIHACKFVSCS